MEILGIFTCVILFIAWLVGCFWLLSRSTGSYGGEAWAWGISLAVAFALPIAVFIGLCMEADRKPFDGAVYKKVFEPEHTTWVMSGKVMVPIHVPDRWYMILKSPETGESRSCDIPQFEFDQFELGSIQHCGGY